MPNTLVIDASDNVATALEPIAAGTAVRVQAGGGTTEIVVRDDIPYGHKFALAAIANGTPVRKYGANIGNALNDIGLGEHVHIHNVAGARLRGDAATGS